MFAAKPRPARCSIALIVRLVFAASGLDPYDRALAFALSISTRRGRDLCVVLFIILLVGLTSTAVFVVPFGCHFSIGGLATNVSLYRAVCGRALVVMSWNAGSVMYKLVALEVLPPNVTRGGSNLGKACHSIVSRYYGEVECRSDRW
jgi:hypothetical protein